jgi:hypothetical protein
VSFLSHVENEYIVGEPKHHKNKPLFMFQKIYDTSWQEAEAESSRQREAAQNFKTDVQHKNSITIETLDMIINQFMFENKLGSQQSLNFVFICTVECKLSTPRNHS